MKLSSKKANTILWHTTSESNLESILAEGLIGCEDEALDDGIAGVNFTNDPQEFYRDIFDDEVWIKVDSSRLDPSLLNCYGGWWWRYNANVPMTAIIGFEKEGAL
jgi:hypothetical protein